MTLQRLDPADGPSVERFERAFHASFSRAKANRLARRLWQWDDEAGRIRPSIPYEDQLIFVRWQEDGDVDTAVAINWRLEQYQAARLGFEPPADLSGHCEILALFSQRDADLVGLRTFLCESAVELMKEGYRSADATCTDRLLPVYTHIGGEPIGTRSLEGENRTLLRFRLAEVAQLHDLT
ncbi:MAG: hypothetical protein ACKO0M_06985 [Cyanobium sp.]